MVNLLDRLALHQGLARPKLRVTRRLWLWCDGREGWIGTRPTAINKKMPPTPGKDGRHENPDQKASLQA